MDNQANGGLGKTVFLLVIAGMALFTGLTMFPGISSAITSNLNTTGFSDMLKGAVTLLPYGVLFFVGYATYRSWGNK